MFKEYQSKPITRSAHLITDLDKIHKVEGLEATYTLVPYDSPNQVQFAAYEEVKVGDYIVYLKDDDIYHCSAEVFAERNIV
jgi:hypothetical protein